MGITTIETKRFEWRAMGVLIFLLITRFIAMWLIPLNDSTEARYAEIARKMLETGDFITPLHDYGIPFWAKPPLSTWLSALSMGLFGVNEWAARLPSFFLSIAVLALVYYLAERMRGRFYALTATLILAGSFVFYLDIGTVMTDPAFLFSVTMTMVAFWSAMTLKEPLAAKIWSYLFFVGLGVGLLAKGPLIFVLTGMPIFFWCLKERAWLSLWQRFPWFLGTALTAVIAIPWYWLAERKTPGFLNYFIIGEHLNRFLKPGWSGDKYGFAHHAPLGMIWVYALIGLLPWVFPVITAFVKKKTRRLPVITGWHLFLYLWFFIPLLFFSFASNIIYPYILPAMPGAALLLAEYLHEDYFKPWIIRLAPISGCLFLIATALFLFKPEGIEKSQKKMVASWKIFDPLEEGHLIYWGDKIEPSAQFYSKGKAHLVHSSLALQNLIAEASKDVLVVAEDQVAEIPESLLHKMNIMKTLAYGSQKCVVFSYRTT